MSFEHTVARVWQRGKASERAEPIGTGIFLAHNRVLTCQHVVDDLDDEVGLYIDLGGSTTPGADVTAVHRLSEQRGYDVPKREDLAVLDLDKAVAGATVPDWDLDAIEHGTQVTMHCFRRREDDKPIERIDTSVTREILQEGVVELRDSSAVGYSGGPVTDRGGAKVRGVVVAFINDEPKRSLIIPATAAAALLERRLDLKVARGNGQSASRFVEALILAGPEHRNQARALRVRLGRLGILAHLGPEEIDPSLSPNAAYRLAATTFDAVVVFADPTQDRLPEGATEVLSAIPADEIGQRMHWIGFGRWSHIAGELGQWPAAVEAGKPAGQRLEGTDSLDAWVDALTVRLLSRRLQNAETIGIFVDQRGDGPRVGRPTLLGEDFAPGGPILVVRPDDGARSKQALMPPSEWETFRKDVAQLMGALPLNRTPRPHLWVRADAQLAVGALLGAHLNRSHGFRVTAANRFGSIELDLSEWRAAPRPSSLASAVVPADRIFLADDGRAIEMKRVENHARQQGSHASFLRTPRSIESREQITEIASDLVGAYAASAMPSLELYTTLPSHAVQLVVSLCTPHPLSKLCLFEWSQGEERYVPYLIVDGSEANPVR